MGEQAKELRDYLVESLIFIKPQFKQQKGLFEEVHRVAFANGYVRADFCERVQSREAEFPTGIQLENMGVAIPHTDSECVIKEFIAIVVNKVPVNFNCMDNPIQETPASVVFVLGLNQPHSQLEMLQSLMSIIQDDQRLGCLLSSQTAIEVIEALQ